MSSHHDHDHHGHHDHDHNPAHAHHHHDHPDHDHHGHHDHEHGSPALSFEEKLIRMFEHWVKHNESHAQTYADWREKATANGKDGVAVLLGEIARLSDRLTEKLKEGLTKARTG